MAPKKPLQLQAHAYDCGPASLVVVLQLNGIRARKKEVQVLAGTTPENGTLGEGMVRVLVKFGLPAKVWNTKRLADIKPFFNTAPLILSVDRGGHWCVLLSVYEKHAVIFDPWYGTLVMSLKALVQRWRHVDGTFYAISGAKT